jgi:hypothetical protein
MPVSAARLVLAVRACLPSSARRDVAFRLLYDNQRRLLRPRELAPLLVVETKRDRSAFVGDVATIISLLNPWSTARRQTGLTFEGIFFARGPGAARRVKSPPASCLNFGRGGPQGALTIATTYSSRAHPARGRRKAPAVPGDPRNEPSAKPCSRRESRTSPGQCRKASPASASASARRAPPVCARLAARGARPARC